MQTKARYAKIKHTGEKYYKRTSFPSNTNSLDNTTIIIFEQGVLIGEYSGPGE